MHKCIIESPVGNLLIAHDDVGLTAVRRTDEPPAAPTTPLLADAARQLDAYFAGTLTAFDLPVHLDGTPFQRACWQVLTKIPYGTTLSYGEQAKRIGKPKATRAVGGANHRNPVCIIVPCHRVIGANGALTGYGAGLGMKQWLLAHEQEVIHRK